MPCRVCDNTMQLIAQDGVSMALKVFWCSRCGSLLEQGSEERFESPVLVRQVQAASAVMPVSIRESVGILPMIGESDGEAQN
jgi:hypothetical protein